MTTITIPASVGSRVKVILNGKEYVLPTGVALSVPEEVAALLADNVANAPKDGREPMPWNEGILYGELREAVGEADALALASYPHDTASGAVASFPDGAALPVRGLTVAITPVQSGSGDPAPDNVRPITGWTQAKIMRAGKNLLSNGWTSQTKYGVVWTVNADGTMAAAQTATNNSQANITDGQVPYRSLGLVRGQTYFLSGCPSGGDNATYYLQANFYDSTGTILPSTRGKAQDTGNGISFTLDSDCAYVWVFAIVRSGTTAPSGTWKPMLEPGSTGTAYEPYNGETVTIDLGGTIYSGTLDVTTGVLTVDRASLTFDGSVNVVSVDYHTGSGNYYTKVANQINGIGSVSGNAHIISDKFLGSTGVVTGHCYMTGNGSSLVAVLPDQTITTVAGATAWFQSNPTQFVYELANPFTVQLTPVQVETLVGTNAVWADTGDSTVDYYADPTLFVEKKTASPVYEMTAGANIASGDYFMVGGKLYLATAAIAKDADIVPGTNCTLTDIAEALNTITA